MCTLLKISGSTTINKSNKGSFVLLPHVGHFQLAGSDITRSKLKELLTSISGVYVWTHIKTNNQYVGSSKNLASRLGDYLRTTYHQGQLKRAKSGTLAISRAMVKYPVLAEQWTLDIYPCTDYLALEEFCLVQFICSLNIRRTATPGPYNPNTLPINQGENNPHFGKLGSVSAHWGGKHSEEQRANWSVARSNSYFIYSIISKKLVAGPLLGLKGLSEHFNLTLRKAESIAYSGSIFLDQFIITKSPFSKSELELQIARSKLVTGSNWINSPLYLYNNEGTILLAKFSSVKEYFSLYSPSKLILQRLLALNLPWNNYLFSLSYIESADNSLDPNNSVQFIGAPIKKGHAVLPIYGFNPDSGSYKVWPSVRACLVELKGSPDFNPATLLLRLKHNELYEGYYLSTSPFD